MNKGLLYRLLLVIGLIFVLTGCGSNEKNVQNVGMLLDGSINDQVWGSKGYAGLLEIGNTYKVDVFYKENIKEEQEIMNAVEEFVQDGVNLIFGHSSIYGKYFVDIAGSYPNVHFVYFNGGYTSNNVTSLNFDSHSMGFFGGMLAGRMTTSDHVAIIAAHEWQPEIEGFYEGVKYENPSAEINMNFINDWNDTETAEEIYDQITQTGVDVVYPTGDAFSKEIIEKAVSDDLFAIGYVSDQSGFGGGHVLTSTIQHVDKLYRLAAELFNEGELKGTIQTYDFQDDVITLGPYSSAVPEDYQEYLTKAVERYKETEFLPNEQ
ncbi:BMP family ABC transporter substrate-binding protein [Oceanobacillus manasiensis]|uniref:BMP family ABC transporter substrate-binding protein n=1 Tax=Oceanobacillus manasiensis TaxID=586413 RepID=UPI0005A9621E|nr:BMP family ABC transporter substrate-binding protein [Oceanobacillus manasiensis]